MANADVLGYLERFVVLAGQPQQLAVVPDFPGDLPLRDLVGDEAFDADWLLDEVAGRGAEGGPFSEGEPEGTAGAGDGDVPAAAPDRELFLEIKRGPGGDDTVGQNGRGHCDGDSSHGGSVRGEMSFNRPLFFAVARTA